MDTNSIEPLTPPIDPAGPIEAVAPAASWSPRARMWLNLAIVVGVIMVLGGLALWWLRSANSSFVAAALLSEASLYLTPFGLAVIVLAWRTRTQPPDRPFQPQSIVKPRMWFIIIWLIGLVLTLGSSTSILAALETTEPPPLELAVRIVGVTALFITGGVWVFRWVADKLHGAWQAVVSNQVQLRWPRAWLIGWAAVWGAASIVIADLSLVIVNLIVNPQSRSTVTQFTEPLETWTTLFDMLEDPRQAAMVAVGAILMLVVFAPLLEEALKAFGLRLMRRSLHQTGDGLLLGLAAGLGFGVLESSLYLYGLNNWLLGGWLRLGTALMHGAATSIVGVAYVRSLRSGRRGDLFRGYLRAVAMHGLWNGTVVFVVAGLGFVAVSPCVTVFIGLGSIGLLALMLIRVIPRTTTAGAQTAVQEDHRHVQAALPRDWAPMPYNIGWRFMGSQPDVSSILRPPPEIGRMSESIGPMEKPIEMPGNQDFSI